MAWLLNLGFAGGTAVGVIPAGSAVRLDREIAGRRPSYGYGQSYRKVMLWIWSLLS